MPAAPISDRFRNPAGLIAAPEPLGEPNFNRVTIAPSGLAIQRRTTFEQGRGLEVLGHALEYLIDSRMYLIHEPYTAADSEATQILMRLSRQIFHECADIIPPVQRLRIWFAHRLRTSSN